MTRTQKHRSPSTGATDDRRTVEGSPQQSQAPSIRRPRPAKQSRQKMASKSGAGAGRRQRVAVDDASRRFGCPSCESRFTRRFHLNRHRKARHPEEGSPEPLKHEGSGEPNSAGPVEQGPSGANLGSEASHLGGPAHGAAAEEEGQRLFDFALALCGDTDDEDAGEVRAPKPSGRPASRPTKRPRDADDDVPREPNGPAEAGATRPVKRVRFTSPAEDKTERTTSASGAWYVGGWPVERPQLLPAPSRNTFRAFMAKLEEVRSVAGPSGLPKAGRKGRPQRGHWVYLPVAWSGANPGQLGGVAPTKLSTLRDFDLLTGRLEEPGVRLASIWHIPIGSDVPIGAGALLVRVLAPSITLVFLAKATPVFGTVGQSVVIRRSAASVPPVPPVKSGTPVALKSPFERNIRKTAPTERRLEKELKIFSMLGIIRIPIGACVRKLRTLQVRVQPFSRVRGHSWSNNDYHSLRTTRLQSLNIGIHPIEIHLLGRVEILWVKVSALIKTGMTEPVTR
ncbi:MAG: hypothetical protein M4579_005648 [Chaenotheca gracillima]|nr:MAG: hypothetical protein M4579_005648 [Chaenotheca gracillima]